MFLAKTLRRLAVLCLSVGLACAAWPAAAVVSPDEMLNDPALEARARALSKELRCLVCQNESIDESDADLARDLRRIVRERLVAGDTDEDVIGYLTARYGDFVLLNPPVKPLTWALWFGPIVLLLFGGLAAWAVLRPRARAAPAPLSDAERARLEQVLNDPDGPGRD